VSLRRQAAAGVRWTTLTSTLTVAIGLLQMAILTRVLDRADFGLMAMVMAVLGFATVYADMGFSNAIVHRQDATRDQLSTLYWTTLASGAAVAGVAALAEPLVEAFFAEPRLAGPYYWSCLAFVIIPFGQQFGMMLQRELEFRTLALAEVGAIAVGFVVAVVTAGAGAGVYALVWSHLALLAAKAAVLMVVGWRRWRPRRHFARADLSGYLSFGLYQIGERSVYYVAANADYLLIGRVLGATALGVYSIAYQVVIVPLQRLNPVLTRVAFPVFARRQDDDAKLRRGYGELIRLIGFASFPLYAGMLVLAPLAIPVVFGPDWEESVVIVQVLVVMGVAKSLSNPTGSLFLAKGRADIGFWLNVVATAVTVAALLVAVRSGTTAVAWAHAVVGAVFFLVELVVLKRLIGLGPREYLGRLAGPAWTASVMGAAVGAAYLLTREATVSPALLLVALIGLGVVVYAALWGASGRAYLSELWRLVTARAAAGS
jgi:O-antigen/teichoic acid export membrane protein